MIAAFLLALSVPNAPPITALVNSPDQQFVVSGSQAGIEIREPATLKTVRKLATDLANVHDLAFSPDGKTLAASGGRPGERGTVELFDWASGQRTLQVHPHKDVIYAIAWSSDGTTLATASGDTFVKLLDGKTGQTLRTCEGHSRPVLAVTFLPLNKEVVSAGMDESLRVWDAATGNSLRTMTNHTRAVLGLALRQTGDGPLYLLSIGADRTVRIWQPTVGRLVRFARIPSEPRAVAMTLDGRTIMVACVDGKVRALDFETMDIRAELPAINGPAHAIAVAPDGAILVGGQGGQVVSLRLPGK